jgi:hypothetical protein
MGTFSMSGLRKTLDLLVSMTAACYVVTLLGVSSQSSVHLGLIPVSLVASPIFLYFFRYLLICYVRGFPHHFVSILPFGFIYKAG